MKDEAAFKTEFCKSLRIQKGYSIRLAAPTMPGLPDLYCIVPGFMPILLEAKFLKNLPDKKFKRTLEFSPMQLHYINHCNSVQDHAAKGLVGFEWRDQIYCMLYNIYSGVPCVLQSDDLAHHNFVIRQDKKFDIVRLFQQSEVPNMHYKEEIKIPDGISPFVFMNDIKVSIN